MEQIIIHKQTGTNIRKEGKMIRISAEADSQLEALSEETGISKARLADYLLRKAIGAVVVEETEI